MNDCTRRGLARTGKGELEQGVLLVCAFLSTLFLKCPQVPLRV